MIRCNVCGNHTYFAIKNIPIVCDITVTDKGIIPDYDKIPLAAFINDLINREWYNLEIKCGMCGNKFLWRYDANHKPG